MEKILKSCKMIGGIVTVENAEEHYKNNYGDMYSHDGSAIKFYMQHFTKEDFLKWNAFIVKKDIEEYKENDKIIYTDVGEGWKHFFKLAVLIYFTYVEVKELYQQRIELVRKLYKDYGYFMNYLLFSGLNSNVDTEFDQLSFIRYWCADPIETTEEDRLNYELQSPTHSYFYDSKRIRTGLIPDLYYLGYYDLLDEYLEECFLPICLHYRKKGSKYDKYYGINEQNQDDSVRDIRTEYSITDAIIFLKSRGYKLPKELDEFWKERGI